MCELHCYRLDLFCVLCGHSTLRTLGWAAVGIKDRDLEKKICHKKERTKEENFLRESYEWYPISSAGVQRQLLRELATNKNSERIKIGKPRMNRILAVYDNNLPTRFDSFLCSLWLLHS
jgi:hypothetical protein